MKLVFSDIPDLTFSGDDVIAVITDNGNIRPCIGCFGCWVKTPGRCVICDGYENTGELLGKCTELIVVSECVYGGYSPFIKNLFDRGLGYISPHFTVRNGEQHHKRRYDNIISINVYFYGDVTEEEKATAREIIAANALNYDGKVGRVEFFADADEVRRSLQ